MNASLKPLTTPTVEPLSLPDAKHFLDVTHDDDDDLIADLIVSARLQCEHLTGREFVDQAWQLSISGMQSSQDFGPRRVPLRGRLTLPSGESIALQESPVVDVQSVTAGGVVVNPSLYQFDSDQIVFSIGYLGNVIITYSAGYGKNAVDIPRNVVQAIRVLTAFYYEHRSSDAETPSYVDKLLARQKVYFSG